MRCQLRKVYKLSGKLSRKETLYRNGGVIFVFCGKPHYNVWQSESFWHCVRTIPTLSFACKLSWSTPEDMTMSECDTGGIEMHY